MIFALLNFVIMYGQKKDFEDVKDGNSFRSRNDQRRSSLLSEELKLSS